jgi:hypothetical protein
MASLSIIWNTITPNLLAGVPLTYANFLSYRQAVRQANVESATGVGVILSPLMETYCDTTSAFGNTYSILDRMRDGVDKIVIAPEITAGSIMGAKAGIIGNFDACKLLVWGIETVWNPYIYADQFRTKVTINVLMNTAISLSSAFVGWNQN